MQTKAYVWAARIIFAVQLFSSRTFKLNWAKRGNRVQNHHLSVFQKRRKFDSHIAMIQGGQYNKNHFCSVNNLFQISAGKRHFTKSGCIRVSFN